MQNSQSSQTDPSQLPASPGTGPAWDVTDLPTPPDFNFRNVIRIIGPGAIALSMSIGLGEWVLGPLVVTEYGFTMLWVVTVAIILQLAMNLEFVRYTVYTGEPALNGFLRLAPHPLFWGGVYILLSLFHAGWPAWAAASAAPLFAGFSGRLPEPGDEAIMRWLGIGNLILCAIIVAVGGKVERTLEIVNWFMVLFVFGFLLSVCVLIVPMETWWAGFLGFFGLTPGFEFLLIPENVSWILIGGFAAFAGAGGFANLTVSNYMRDKGIGMGSKVGYIPTLVGGKKVTVSPVGRVFPATTANLARWRVWWQYVRCDQVLVWAVGCFVGMFLNCILAAHIIPAGTELSGLAIGAFQAEYLAREEGRLLGFVALVNGFWILFGSQLATIDMMARVNTDLVWGMSERIRRLAGEDIRRVYYCLLGAFVLWGCIAINLAQPKALVLISSNVAGFILVVSAIHILLLNHKTLPRAVRSPWWTRALVASAVLFYGFFFVQNALELMGR